MRLGDLDGVVALINSYKTGSIAKSELLWSLSQVPTIDAVPVVRCAECERRSKSADLTDTVYCPWLKQQMRKTDFCSYGEPKDGDA